MAAVTPLPQLAPPEARPLPLKAYEPQPLVRAQRFASELGQVLSPTQARTFLDCSAKWWFRYGLHLPEPKTSSLSLGSALHRALEVNSREKLATGEDLETSGVVALFRDAWLDQVPETEFRGDEDPKALGRIGEELVRKYMDEAAPLVQPAAVELEVAGEIGGVQVCGRVDLLDAEGRIVDVKTAARKPNGVSPAYAFQLATYRQITPGASGEARLDTLVKTKTIQLVSHSYTVSEGDLRSTVVLFPLVQEGMRSGLYYPNRNSFTCSRRNCAFWAKCEAEYGGAVEA
ncbi:MAG: PD-(D/E)XK nuclease family protein [Bryobacteraceae bacterium]|nr:PD-(D/E)XK nuclease family protein [Bryobacteraceae bacterium]